jgi:hypothetical protein
MRTLLILGTICFVESSLALATAKAGPCSEEIAQIEQIMVQSPTGPTTQQTVDSQLHRQPTPQSVEKGAGRARAEADALLVRAKALDREGNASGCMEIVARIRTALRQ